MNSFIIIIYMYNKLLLTFLKKLYEFNNSDSIEKNKSFYLFKIVSLLPILEALLKAPFYCFSLEVLTLLLLKLSVCSLFSPLKVSLCRWCTRLFLRCSSSKLYRPLNASGSSLYIRLSLRYILLACELQLNNKFRFFLVQVVCFFFTETSYPFS